MSDTTKDPGCGGCKWMRRQDIGYSNYTVTGVAVACLRGLNPEMPLNDEDADVESKHFNKVLGFGETCTARTEGEGPWFDHDGETTNEQYASDPELYALLVAFDVAAPNGDETR